MQKDDTLAKHKHLCGGYFFCLSFLFFFIQLDGFCCWCENVILVNAENTFLFIHEYMCEGAAASFWQKKQNTLEVMSGTLFQTLFFKN